MSIIESLNKEKQIQVLHFDNYKEFSYASDSELDNFNLKYTSTFLDSIKTLKIQGCNTVLPILNYFNH